MRLHKSSSFLVLHVSTDETTAALLPRFIISDTDSSPSSTPTSSPSTQRPRAGSLQDFARGMIRSRTAGLRTNSQTQRRCRGRTPSCSGRCCCERMRPSRSRQRHQTRPSPQRGEALCKHRRQRSLRDE